MTTYSSHAAENIKEFQMIRRILLCLSVLTLGVTTGFAQTAQMSGFVSDPTGTVISGAKGSMIDTATDQARGAITNSSSLYAFTLLEPSRYRMVVEAPGFKTE